MKMSASEAVTEKERGNAAYKLKDFETALSHYNKAIELDPGSIVFLNNKAAVYFEQKKYRECIEVCKEGVEVGRANRADFKLVAKALTRIGNSYLQLEDLSNGLMFLNKSLSEHRDPAVVKKTIEVQAAMKDFEARKYVNPEIALEEKTKGNTFFTEGKFPQAIAAYTEAVKRNPDDAKVFSNRSACYNKLMEFGLALKDADECIRLDPKFVKGFLRKATCHIAMKEDAKAETAYQMALELDPNCQEALDGYRKCAMSESPEDVQRKAMSDPEVQTILKDPAMRMILQQMTENPSALKEHMQNPDIAQKLQKLLEVGILRVG